MMYDYHYRKISLQLTRDLTPVRVILSMRNKFNSPKVNSNFLHCMGTKQIWGGGWMGGEGWAGRKPMTTLCRVTRMIKYMTNHWLQGTLVQSASASASKHPLKPVNTTLFLWRGKTHNLLTLTSCSLLFITHPSHSGVKRGGV